MNIIIDGNSFLSTRDRAVFTHRPSNYFCFLILESSFMDGCSVLQLLLLLLPFFSIIFEFSEKLGLIFQGPSYFSFATHLGDGACDTGLRRLGSGWTEGAGAPKERTCFFVFLLYTGTSCPTQDMFTMYFSPLPGIMTTIKCLSYSLLMFLIPPLWR